MKKIFTIVGSLSALSPIAHAQTNRENTDSRSTSRTVMENQDLKTRNPITVKTGNPITDFLESLKNDFDINGDVKPIDFVSSSTQESGPRG